MLYPLFSLKESERWRKWKKWKNERKKEKSSSCCADTGHQLRRVDGYITQCGRAHEIYPLCFADNAVCPRVLTRYPPDLCVRPLRNISISSVNLKSAGTLSFQYAPDYLEYTVCCVCVYFIYICVCVCVWGLTWRLKRLLIRTRRVSS